jgi:phage protein D
MDKNDVSVVLKPIIEKNKWTGDVSIGLVSTNQMTLSREDQIDFLKLARRFCALFPLMLDDKKVESEAERLAESFMPIEYLLTESLKKHDNVIHVNFKDDK